MDLTGSIMDATAPAIDTVYGSFADMGGTGSSFIDTLVTAPAYAFQFGLMFLGGLGGDLGSTGSAGLA